MEINWFGPNGYRLDAERFMMKQQFPHFKFKVDEERVFWEGVITTKIGTQYFIEIIYPSDYPFERPIVNVIEPELESDCPLCYPRGNLRVYPDDWKYKKCNVPAGVKLVVDRLEDYERSCSEEGVSDEVCQ